MLRIARPTISVEVDKALERIALIEGKTKRETLEAIILECAKKYKGKRVPCKAKTQKK